MVCRGVAGKMCLLLPSGLSERRLLTMNGYRLLSVLVGEPAEIAGQVRTCPIGRWRRRRHRAAKREELVSLAGMASSAVIGHRRAGRPGRLRLRRGMAVLRLFV